jgi:hypothetical protein
MDVKSWIADELRTPLERELIKAFETELVGRFGTTDFVVDEQNFEHVCWELNTYCPETLQSALPYVLVGFLRKRELTREEAIAITPVAMFLNIRSYPHSDLRENLGDWRSALARAQGKEGEVSGFSEYQAHAIRLWLEAVRNSGVFLTEETTTTDLNYAIAYWSDRE